MITRIMILLRKRELKMARSRRRISNLRKGI
jgi:hypothetical protein